MSISTPFKSARQHLGRDIQQLVNARVPATIPGLLVALPGCKSARSRYEISAFGGPTAISSRRWSRRRHAPAEPRIATPAPAARALTSHFDAPPREVALLIAQHPLPASRTVFAVPAPMSFRRQPALAYHSADRPRLMTQITLRETRPSQGKAPRRKHRLAAADPPPDGADLRHEMPHRLLDLRP